MYAGKIVEEADVNGLFAQPRHPYTLGLLKSIPRWDADHTGLLATIPGQPPDMLRPPGGCPFNPRCQFVMDQCRLEEPQLTPADHGGRKACFADLSVATSSPVSLR